MGELSDIVVRDFCVLALLSKRIVWVFDMGLFEVIIPPQFITCSRGSSALPPVWKKQCVAPTGKQSIVLLNGTNSKTYFSLLKEGTPIKYKYIAVTVFRKPHNTVWGRHSCT